MKPLLLPLEGRKKKGSSARPVPSAYPGTAIADPRHRAARFLKCTATHPTTGVFARITYTVEVQMMNLTLDVVSRALPD